MKKVHVLWLLAFLLLAPVLFQSCSDDDGEVYVWYPYLSPNALVTVKGGTDSCFLQLDDETTLWPVNLSSSPFGEKEVRALVHFTDVDEDRHSRARAVYVNWMDSIRNKEKPFCLFVHHKAPHRTWMPDLCDLDLYDNVTYPMPENFYDKYEGRIPASKQEMSIIKDMDLVYDLKMADKENEIHTNTGLEQAGRHMYNQLNPEQKAAWDKHYDPIIAKFKKDKLSGKALAEWKYQQYMHDYMRVIHSIDRNVGRLLKYLEENDLLENTMIVYTSDQGFYMGEHGWFDKRFMYEESFRTPLLVRLPGGKKGDIPQMVQNIDYGPTILDLAGVEVPSDMHGTSFLPLLKGEEVPEWRKSLYYHFYEYPAEHAVRRHYGVRTERYKLIHFYNDIDCWELYDLQEDPQEMDNIYGKPGTEELTKELKAELLKLQVQYDDPIRNIYKD